MTLGDTLFTLVTFLVLMLAVGKVAWKPVSKMMADRQQKISGDLDYAEKSRKDADALAARKMARNSGNHWSTLPTQKSPR